MKKFMFGIIVGNVVTNLAFAALVLSDDELSDAFERVYIRNLKAIKTHFTK